jgi:hypothetical protein
MATSDTNTPKKHRSLEQWRELIVEQKASGQTQGAFCQSRGISLMSFGKAVSKLRRETGFVELTSNSPARTLQSSSPVWESEVVFPNGISIRIRGR